MVWIIAVRRLYFVLWRRFCLYGWELDGLENNCKVIAFGQKAPTDVSERIIFGLPLFYRQNQIRGHTTYFTSTYMNAVTDIRYQYVIEVYRAPKNHLNIDGWGSTQNLQHVLECVNSTTHKLT